MGGVVGDQALDGVRQRIALVDGHRVRHACGQGALTWLLYRALLEFSGFFYCTVESIGLIYKALWAVSGLFF